MVTWFSQVSVPPNFFNTSLVIFHSSDESHLFEEWFQDLQLSVNECFENPECKQDVEASMKRLAVSSRLDITSYRII